MNTFGQLLRVTTFGESHGVALGCVVDGCPPGLPLEAEDIQAELDQIGAGTGIGAELARRKGELEASAPRQIESSANGDAPGSTGASTVERPQAGDGS